MHRTRPALYAAALITLSLAACRSDSNTTVDGNNTVDVPAGGTVKIQNIQNDMMPKGTAVRLEGVVVTAIDTYGAKTGNFWVEDPAGGPFSGVEVFGAPLTSVSALAVGDLVTIDGAVKDEFALMTDMTGRTVTELKPVTGGMMTVTKTGTGTVPAPAMVDALAIGKLGAGAAQDAEWEKWEGVLITVTNVSQTGPIKPIGSGTGADPTFTKFSATGNLVVESSLAAFPAAVDVGTCYASITGVGDYFFDYLLLPRSPTELATGGTGCPMPETGATLCGDGLDNDGNGFADCMDNSCLPEAACHDVTTITAIQTAATVPTKGVEVDGVYVTAISFNKKNLWVSSKLAAAPNEGIYVVHGVALDANIVVGAKINVLGKAAEYNNDTLGSTLTEIGSSTLTFVAAPGGAPVPVMNQQASSLIVEGTGEPYESVLVKLSNVKVTKIPDPNANYVGELSQGGTVFLSDDDILRTTDALATCYKDITGIWTYQVFNNAYGLLPISVTLGGTCP